MDERSRQFFELRFRVQFLESKAAAFQSLFVDVMSKAHPGDFIPCRPWGRVGDRKNDGYLKSERTLFQVYAPNDMKLSDTVHKLESDFREALPHWQKHFDTWVFVHNAHGGLPPGVVATLLALESEHPTIKVTHWGFEELLLRFRHLTPEALRSLYGSPPGPAEARQKARLAQDLVRRGEHSDGIKAMTEALAIARASGDEDSEVEILAGLSILLSGRRDRHAQRYYLQHAEAKLDKVASPVTRALYFRARAAVLEEQQDLDGAERAYLDALTCCTELDDDKGNLANQSCIVRSSLVHFLCNRKRIDDAVPILNECERYARDHRVSEDGELLQAALEAGIHLALEIGDEAGAIRRITELEEFAGVSRLADRIGGAMLNIANEASHRKAHHAALAAADTSIRLGHRCHADSRPSFLVGALYTKAMVIMQAGDHATALCNAEALLDACQRPEDSAVKYAAQHLIAEIRRCSGDSQTAVDLARLALSAATGRPEDIAFAKLALARALNDNGETGEALKQAKEAWVLAQPAGVPANGIVDFISDIMNYASQLGADADLAGAMAALEQLTHVTDEVAATKARAAARASANQQLRQRLLEVLGECDPGRVAGTKECTSLPQANAAVTRSLLRLWDEIPESIASSYDFWGRGNFQRMLLNARRFPDSVNITLEVRTLDDVRRAIRVWGLYADFLLLLWKGPTENGLAITPCPEDYDDPGGWGYIICMGDVLRRTGSKKKWHPAVAYISSLPTEVTAFLATEARVFVASGRLVVVPAVGAGCINPGHGPFEQLLAEAANAIPSIRWKGYEGTPIGLVPYSPDAPLELLAELAETESDRLRQLRLLLLKRARNLRPDDEGRLEAKTLSLEIEEAFCDFAARSQSFARQYGLARAMEPLTGATAPFRSNGRGLASAAPESPFAPLFILRNLGYGWRVDGPEIPKLPPRFEPQEGDIVGTWLAPPSPGWTIPTIRISSGE